MNTKLLLFLFPFFLVSCIGDDFVEDFVEPVLRITATTDSLQINTSFQFRALYFNNVGQEVAIQGNWASTNSDILAITPEGEATAVSAGEATLTVSYDDGTATLEASTDVVVSALPVVVGPSFDTISGSIATTTFYQLEGDFELAETGDGLQLSFASNYQASTALPGLYVYLSNNPNSIANALEIGAVTVFNGEHSYDIPMVGLNEYSHLVYFCKPFNVKVGDGAL